MVNRLFAVSLIAALAACGGDDDDDVGEPDSGGPANWQSMTVPRSTVPEAGIRREVFIVDGATADANPTTGDATPAELDAIQVVRFRADVDPPAPARAILVAMPGFLGGANNYEYLARHLVRRSLADDDPIEVWAIDRRANLLEDLRGVQTAEAAGNPEIANGWYNGLDTIDGERFPGHVGQDAVPYMSEWGLAVHVEDVRRVIALVPEAERPNRVFFVGHSLGASFAEAYAAWRFADGTRGFDELAGIVLIDGLLGGDPITETDYVDGYSAGFFSSPGLDKLREDGPRYFELPIFGVAVLHGLEILALRTLVDPDGVVDDEVRDNSLRIQLSLGNNPVPAMTNAAALGMGLDDSTNSITFTAVSCGEAGGPMEEYENALADRTLQRPSDPDATYTWIDATDADPDDFTPLANLAHSMTDGATNFTEWYFPMRLPLDLAAVAGARVPEDGYQAAAGLRAFDGALIDVPILALPTELVLPAEYDALIARVPLATVTVTPAMALTHIDPVTAADRDDNPIPDAIYSFATTNTAAGGVAVPIQN